MNWFHKKNVGKNKTNLKFNRKNSPILYSESGIFYELRHEICLFGDKISRTEFELDVKEKDFIPTTK